MRLLVIIQLHLLPADLLPQVETSPLVLELAFRSVWLLFFQLRGHCGNIGSYRK